MVAAGSVIWVQWFCLGGDCHAALRLAMTPSPEGEGKRIATDGGAVLAMTPLPPPSEAPSPKGKALGRRLPRRFAARNDTFSPRRRQTDCHGRRSRPRNETSSASFGGIFPKGEGFRGGNAVACGGEENGRVDDPPLRMKTDKNTDKISKNQPYSSRTSLNAP